MIVFKKGNILEADVEALVNTVNCVGIMGRGIALQYKKAFPKNYKAYKIACDRNDVQPGKMFVHDLARLENPRYIINFPTKRHWRNKSRLKDIESGLTDLTNVILRKKITSVAIPPLGCGLGGLKWKDVRPLIEEAMNKLPDVHAIVFEPGGAPEPKKIVNKTEKPHLTAGRAALLALMGRYLSGFMDYNVSLLEIHKMMYFLQEAGEPLKLKYVKGPFGPYAENLRHVISLLDGHYLNGFGDGDDTPAKPIELAPNAAKEAEVFLDTTANSETKTRFNCVSNFIEGYETSFGLELLATVYWVKEKEGAKTIKDALEKTYAWSSRKQMFSENHISTAWETIEQRSLNSCKNGKSQTLFNHHSAS